MRRSTKNDLLRYEKTQIKQEKNKIGKSLKAISKQNIENAKEDFARENKQKGRSCSARDGFCKRDGTNGFRRSATNNEDIVASSLKSIISMALDLLKVQVQMSIAGATAQSLAQPDSVATFGASGLARAAILVGLIETAFAAVKGVVNSVIGGIGGKNSKGSFDNYSSTRRVVQRYSGKYDVIGADDGRKYSVPYIGPAQTGVISRPTLVGEYGSELIVSSRFQPLTTPCKLSSSCTRHSGVKGDTASRWKLSGYKKSTGY